jgi:hypothetical protein
VHTVPGAPPGRALAIQNLGNLNPFVYQESAGSANGATTYWNPGSVQELPVSEQFTSQLDFYASCADVTGSGDGLICWPPEVSGSRISI